MSGYIRARPFTRSVARAPYDPVTPIPSYQSYAATTNMPLLGSLYNARGANYMSMSDPYWDRMFDTTANDFRSAISNIDNILNTIIDMPSQVRTRSGLLTGVPIGYLLYKLRERLTNTLSDRNVENFIRGLYITGTVRNFETTPVGGDVQLDMESKRIVEFPLEKVVYFPPSKYRAATEMITTEGLAKYLSSIQIRTGGSDVSTYIMMSDVSIARRTSPSIPYANIRSLRVLQTGGFSNVLYEEKVYEMEVLGVEYKVFIPGGEGNCFESCVRWGYIEGKGAELFCEMSLMDELERESPLLRLEREIDQVIEEARKFMKDVSRTAQYKLRRSSSVGYTDNSLKRFSLYCNNNGISIYCGRFDRLQIHNVCSWKSESIDSQEIFITKVDCRGNLHDHAGDREMHVYHAIGVHPPLSYEQKEDPVFIENFKNKLRMITTVHMKKYFSEATYDEKLNETKIRDLIQFQKNRYEKKETGTLIFSTNEPDEMKSIYNVKDPFVFAYDLETVTNHMENQDMVYEPFRRNHSVYDPIESQIPFSAQWVPVNVSDSELYKDRKRKEEARILTYKTNDEDGYKVIDPNGKYKLFQEVMLQDVTTEYGDYQLGKCVEDMFVHIAEYIHKNGGDIGYLYAHNGVGFDSYVCLQFNRFKITKILKTPRGILSMSIRVPVGVSKDMVTLILRDTKVQVPGSLSSICKSYGVPKEWCKLDFPIAMITAKTCYEPEVMKVSKPYGENDVRSLAYVVKAINDSISESMWEPCNLKSSKPPITQFLTTMSMVKKATFNHFVKELHHPLDRLPKAVDIPSLRRWLKDATNGGRVNAYARTYMNRFFPEILDAYLIDDKPRMKYLHSEIKRIGNGMRVYDVTSLYPAAQSNCPQPTGDLYFCTAQEAFASIEAIHCDECSKRYSLCPKHTGPESELRPFTIVIVKNLKPPKSKPYLPMFGRKKYGCSGPEGLVYSLEDTEDFNRRSKPKKINDLQSYSNVDLYWMTICGYTYEVIGGFGWSTSNDYHSFIAPAFEKRIEAKKAGNKVLSNSLKLMYNSSFGVTCQNDIDEDSFITTLPEDLREYDYKDERVLRAVNKHSLVNGDEELKENILLPSGQTYFTKQKIKEFHECYGDQSPMQIGCAVLSWARHIMNLFMVPFPLECCQTYTDTDSDAIMDSVVQEYMTKIPGLIDNSTDARLGSLKNDHLEGPNGEFNGNEPYVILSLIGTKKVKMHVTLNEEGEMKIFNTFKGLNASSIESGIHMHPDYAAHQTSQVLIDINELGRSEPVTVTQWNRNMHSGIIIGEHEQESYSKTYLGHSAGQQMKIDSYGNVFEMFVPHGVELTVFLREDKKDYYYSENTLTHQYGLRTLSCGDFHECANYRRDELAKYGFSHNRIRKMTDKYYSNRNKEYTKDSDEYKKIVSLIRSYEK